MQRAAATPRAPDRWRRTTSRSRRRRRRCGRTRRGRAAAGSRPSTPPCWRISATTRLVVATGRRRRRRGRGSWPTPAPSPARRCRSARSPGRDENGYRLTTTSEIGSMPYSARSARCGFVVGSASMPPCTFGWSVTTRWPRIAGNPVRSATSVTGTPVAAIAAAVPPLETSASRDRATRSPARRSRSCRTRTATRSARLDRSQTAIAALSTCTRTTVRGRVTAPITGDSTWTSANSRHRTG